MEYDAFKDGITEIGKGSKDGYDEFRKMNSRIGYLKAVQRMEYDAFKDGIPGIGEGSKDGYDEFRKMKFKDRTSGIRRGYG